MLRYSQQMIVGELGLEGQQQLAAARVLIIGAGGLGTPVAAYLAAAGVGTIGIMDGDVVAVSNLARQFLYTSDEVGREKASLLAAKLSTQNPGLKIHPVSAMLTAANAMASCTDYDIICDCTDNVEARMLINDVCGQWQKPLVFAAVKEWEGYVAVLHHTQKISLPAIFPLSSFQDELMAGCAITGIINTTCGFAGTVQATEVIKIILHLPSELDGGLLCFNLLTPVVRVFRLNRV